MGGTNSTNMYEDKVNARDHEYRLRKLSYEREKRSEVQEARNKLENLRNERRTLEVKLAKAELQATQVKAQAQHPENLNNASRNELGTLEIEAPTQDAAKSAIEALQSRRKVMLRIKVY